MSTKSMGEDIMDDCGLESREVIEELAYADGVYRTTDSIINAHAMGEVDLWIEHHKPKTPAQWNAWEKELECRGIHDIETRWTSRDEPVSFEGF